MRHWRSQGFKTLMFLDDGAGSANSMHSSRALALAVRTDVLNSGFLLSEKSRFQPLQRAPFLGFIWDLSVGYMYVTQKRLDKLFALLTDAMHNLDSLIRARDLSILGWYVPVEPFFRHLASRIVTSLCSNSAAVENTKCQTDFCAHHTLHGASIDIVVARIHDCALKLSLSTRVICAASTHIFDHSFTLQFCV